MAPAATNPPPDATLPHPFVASPSLPAQWAPFDEGAPYVWRRPCLVDTGMEVMPGDPVTPKHFEILGSLKLRRMWHRGYIQRLVAEA